MQSSIRELEQLSEGLQMELRQKEELYSRLKLDYHSLEDRYKEVHNQRGNLDGEKDRKIALLEDEVQYVKKHNEIELGLIKDENEILKQ